MGRTLFIILFLSLANIVFPQSRKGIEKSTDVAMFAAPVAGAVMSYINKDKSGFLQLVGSGAASVAAAYALKYSVSKERPDGSDRRSFPSNHTGLAFMGATFIGQRYGWGYAAPAYAVGCFVGWGRIYAKRHDVWDVLAGAAIGTCCSLAITAPFAKERKLVLSPFVPYGGGTGVHASLSF